MGPYGNRAGTTDFSMGEGGRSLPIGGGHGSDGGHSGSDGGGIST